MPKKKYYNDKMSESRDGSMISGSGFAGLPGNAIQKSYPKGGSYMPENLNDGLSGIDSQVSKDKSGARKNPSKSKY